MAEKKMKLIKWDSADYLKTEKDIQTYLNVCLEEYSDDPVFIAKVLGTIARARGMSKIAKKTGLSREGLYKALSGDGNPEFATILKVMHALGLKLQAKPI